MNLIVLLVNIPNLFGVAQIVEKLYHLFVFPGGSIQETAKRCLGAFKLRNQQLFRERIKEIRVR